MCLLVKQPASTEFTQDFIEDVYNKNKDGFGIMYAEDGKLHVYKCLPTSGKDMYEFYMAHGQGRDCIWHARMQTHGDIDLDNCHPYKVTDEIWLAHNGVLSTGNAADKSKSDTWHFIHNVLKPALSFDPDLMLDPSWQEMIGHIIGGGNKFGLVRADGEMVIINERSGVNFVGAWLSNTYAWSTTKFGFRSSYQTQGYGGYSSYGQGQSTYGARSLWEDEGGAYSDWWSRSQNKIEGKTAIAGTTVNTKYTEEEAAQDPDGSNAVDLTPTQIRPMIRAAFNVWMRNGLAGVEHWCKQVPHKAAAILGYWYRDIDDLPKLVEDDPEEAAVWIEDLFRTDSVTPTMLN